MKQIAVLLLLFLAGCSGSESERPLRIGWATAFAGLGQIMATAEQMPEFSSDRFMRFSTGPEMNEAALQEHLDLVPIGVVPAAILLSRSNSWSIVARLYRFNQMTVVGTESQIFEGTQLRGKKIATGFGTGAHPYILSRFSEWGLTLGQDVTLLNCAPSEQVQALLHADVDAVAAFEPVPAILKGLGKGRVIDSEEHVAFLLARNELIAARPHELQRILRGFRRAVFAVASDRPRANSLYAQISKIEVPLLDLMQEIDPNLTARSDADISLAVTEQELSQSQEIVDSMLSHRILQNPVSLKSRVKFSGESATS